MSSPSVWKQQASFYKDRSGQLQDQVEGLKGLNRVLSNRALELEEELDLYIETFGAIEDEPSEDDVTEKVVAPVVVAPKVNKGKSSKKSK